MTLSVSPEHEEWMRLALAQAELARVAGDVPVGAVLFDESGEVIATGHNTREVTADPTGHAVEVSRAGVAVVDSAFTTAVAVEDLERKADRAAGGHQTMVAADELSRGQPGEGLHDQRITLNLTGRVLHRLGAGPGQWVQLELAPEALHIMPVR